MLLKKMSDLRTEFIQNLEKLPNVKVDLWKDSNLLCVFHNGKEIAHFQNESEIDIRLTPSIIKKKGLRPPQNTSSHLDRSINSRWIVQTLSDDFSDILELLEVATKL